MKKLLLFFIAVFAVITCSGRELHAYTETFAAEEYVCYEADGKLLGETITLTDCELSEKDILFKLGAVYHFSSEIDNIRIVYGYSPRLKHLTLVSGKPVNFQLTFSKNVVTVSNPVNLGSF